MFAGILKVPNIDLYRGYLNSSTETDKMLQGIETDKLSSTCDDNENDENVDVDDTDIDINVVNNDVKCVKQKDIHNGTDSNAHDEDRFDSENKNSEMENHDKDFKQDSVYTSEQDEDITKERDQEEFTQIQNSKSESEDTNEDQRNEEEKNKKDNTEISVTPNSQNEQQAANNNAIAVKVESDVVTEMKPVTVQYLRPWVSYCTGTSGEKPSQVENSTVHKELDTDGTCSEENDQNSDSDDTHNVMKFAETLYKCTLCTTIPSILTSKKSFIDHVRNVHYSNNEMGHSCCSCTLKFKTIEDLKEHVMFSHTGSDISVSCDITGSDITGSHDQEMESVNDSDSDSSGHRQFRAKIVKRTVKPTYDFQNPKQLVDHTGIQTLNGSLDLSKKCSNDTAQKPYEKTLSPKQKEKCDIDIKKITDQIVKSDVQCRSQTVEPGSKFSFVPSHTPEFGEFTKLVREGGNIVYYCQICNWKSPIKSTFQSHCNLAIHKKRVQNPEGAINELEKGPSQGCEPLMKTSTEQGISSKILSQSNNPYLYSQAYKSKHREPDQSLFYKYIINSRAANFVNKSNKTPVVSPYGNSGLNIFETSRFHYKRPSEGPAEFSAKKRKRFTRNPMFSDKTTESESDEDEMNSFTVKNGRKPCLSLLRNKILENSKSAANGLNSTNYDEKVFSRRSPSYKMSFQDGLVKKESCYNSQRMYRCHACSFEYSKIEEYEKHFDKVHKSMLGNMLQTGSPDHHISPSLMWSPDYYGCRKLLETTGSQFSEEKLRTGEIGTEGRSESNGGKLENGNNESGENWRVQKLKEILPGTSLNLFLLKRNFN